MSKEENKPTWTGKEIAIIGMAGRFPGAGNIDEFWTNLKNGVESIVFSSNSELEEKNVGPDLLNHANYVKACIIPGKQEYFDAAFFGYTPLEAQLMNPQIRVFHECVWEALEDAGYDSEQYDGLIGVYGGAISSSYWEALSYFSGKSDKLGVFAASQLNDKDYINTRISYNLDLKGPVLSVHTACSTSLVAVHLACRSLLTGECSMALAGGIAMDTSPKQGYLFQEGMIMSPDGHCRAFDARAKGTVFGEGAGVVVLKRLKNTLVDRDHIYAIIKGSAINNDGKRKVGFTAPSVEAQAEVIRTALRIAVVEPETIGYIETHGTGTTLGDPVEIEALRLAFGTNNRKKCAIGSVKTNIGHLDAAAGIAGLIKTTLTLKYKLIPPTLHFENPNPEIDFANLHFYVNTELKDWQEDSPLLRAGVSSFGIGGTNAHVILEEAPDREESTEKRKNQLMLISGKTKSVLDKASKNLVEFLNRNKEINLADVAYTLQVGRRSFPFRKMMVCSSVNEAIEAFSAPISQKVHISYVKEDNKPVIFMFSGQGSQYVGMGLDLYRTEPVFREEMNRCFELARSIMEYDLKEIMYPDTVTIKTEREDIWVQKLKNLHNEQVPNNFSTPSAISCVNKESSDINQTAITQPLLFIFEYSLAKLIMKWGITPHAMIGHSIGEYVAACLSGVLSLEDAVKLVVLRGRLMQQMPTGAMLSISISEKALLPLLPPEISLAAINSPNICVVSGAHKTIDLFEKQLISKDYQVRRLQTSHAFHSDMMNPALERFATEVRQVQLKKPKIPFKSNVTGNWITEDEATDPSYWAMHLRNPVQFSPGVEELLNGKNSIFIEVGPGQALVTLVRKHLNIGSEQKTLNLVRHPKENASDDSYLLGKLGELWLYGEKINWQEFYSHENRNRISLPTYPFENQFFPIETDILRLKAEMFSGVSRSQRNTDMTDWFYIPSWERSPLPPAIDSDEEKSECWLVFCDGCGLGFRLVQKLSRKGIEVISVKNGQQFNREGRDYVINPQYSKDYDTLFRELRSLKKIPCKILHFWGVTGNSEKYTGPTWPGREQDLGLYSLMNIVQALGRQDITSEIRLEVVTDHMQEVNGVEEVHPEKATLLGAVKVIPFEYANIKSRSIDIDISNVKPGSTEEDRLMFHLEDEFNSDSIERIVAYRGNYRWIQVMRPYPLAEGGERSKRLRAGGIYLITGAFGGMGFTLAQYLAKYQKAKLIMVGRSAFPVKTEWEQWLSEHSPDDKVSSKIKKLKQFEKYGAEIFVANADVANAEQMQAVVHQALDRFGEINGVIHTAGVIDYGGVIHRRTPEMTENCMAAKVKGTLILDNLLRDVPIDFFLLFSSIGNILYGNKFGQVGYNAANEFLDAFAYYKYSSHGTLTIAINWLDWTEVGMSVRAFEEQSGKANSLDFQSFFEDALSPSEGVDVFKRILGFDLHRVIISSKDLSTRMKYINTPKDIRSIPLEIPEKSSALTGILYPRPELSVEYVAPRNEIEKKITEIFQQFFGIDKVGIYDNFFDLGASSLDLFQINILVKKELGKEISIILFFEYPTVAALVEYLQTKESDCSAVQEVINSNDIIDKGKNKLRQLRRK